MNLTANWDGTVDNILWSNDGKKIYFTAPVDGTKQLFEVNFPGLTKIAIIVKQITNGDFDVNDIVGFTKLSSLLPAEELIDLLDIVFTRFDAICKKHGLEKIKTIGDAYMAACGAPVRYDNHAERAANAAIEMLEHFTIDHEFSVPVNLRFRIGLHSGSVVAGIIGENKYSYDLWGDAVNTASRMESHGEAGKIHVSEEFMQAFVGLGSELSPSSPSSLRFVDRGEMEIKGKGMMKTYFLEKRSNQ